MNIVVTLCTRQRPVMLRSCLWSVVGQRLPQGTTLSVVVVENNEASMCQAIVEEIARECDVPIEYAWEPAIGIPIARNRALDLALARRPDWIAFIDDDEVADPEWLASFVEASKTLGATVLHGPVQGLHADSWQIVANRKQRPTGLRLATAGTNNTMMRAYIAAPDGLALRFDETMRLCGGSDKDFFLRAVDRGAVIAWVDSAIVCERVPPERLTLGWRLQRERSIGANALNIAIRRKGVACALGRNVLKLVGRLTVASVEFGLGAVIYPFNRKNGSHLVTMALRRVWWAVGNVGAIMNFTPQRYVETDGR